MGKVEATIRSEIIRLAKREMRRVTVPLSRDVRSLKGTVSQLRKTVSIFEKVATRWESERSSEKVSLVASPEEIKGSRFSPRLIKALRKRLNLTQKELAILTGVTVGAIYQWEQGIFDPRADKKGILVALRKMGRRDVRKRLMEKKASVKAVNKKPRRTPAKRRGRKRTSRSSRK
jgi:DNA-binding transcriptional regulator YiaG